MVAVLLWRTEKLWELRSIFTHNTFKWCYWYRQETGLTGWLLGKWDGCISTCLQQGAACSIHSLLVHLKVTVSCDVVLFSLIEVTFTVGLVTSIRRIDVSFFCLPEGDSKYATSLIHLHQIVWCHIPEDSSVHFNFCVPQTSYCIHSFQWFSHMICSTYFSSL